VDGERQIDRAMRRTKRYWYEDGLSELASGVIFVLLALVFYLELAAPPWSGFSAIALPAIVIGGASVARWLVVAAKERLTYPRTGYVAYPRAKSARSRAASALVAGTLGISISLLLVNAPAALAWIPALQGLAIGAALLYLGNQLGLGRFYALAFLSVVAGTAASRAGLGDIAGSAAYFAVMGLALAAGGALTLRSYLRATEHVSE
jgi:hypothetical protein